MSEVKIKVTPKVLTVKLVALRGLPAAPTQEQINTAVTEYMDDHPESQIPDGSVSMSKLSLDVAKNVSDVPNKADQIGSYPDLIAGTADNLLSSSYQTDKTPYIIRRTPYGAREKGSIVGGSLVWNQLCLFATGSYTNNGVDYTRGSDGTLTVNGTATASSYHNLGTKIQVQGHKVLLCGCPTGGSSSTYYLRDGYTSGKYDTGQGIMVEAKADTIVQIVVANGVTVNNLVFKPQIFDLTVMFGQTIADYIYSVEQSTAGAGVAWCKAYNPKMFSTYQPYNAGEIISVNTSAHKMVGKNLLKPLSYSDGVNVSTYRVFRVPLPKGTRLCMSFKDKDTSVDVSTMYVGFVSSNYASGTLSSDMYRWIMSRGVVQADKRNIPISGDESIYLNAILFYPRTQEVFDAIMARYDIQIEYGSTATAYEPYTSITYSLSPIDLRGIPTLVGDHIEYDGDIYRPSGEVERRYGYRAYQSGDESDANVLTDGTNTVYKLATPTIEQAEPYTALQICDPNGTEEWVGASMPVGHETKYYADLKGKIEGIPDAPSADGTYTLKVTVSNGVATYSWV